MRAASIIIMLSVCSAAPALGFDFNSPSAIQSRQVELAGKPIGERIAQWARSFVGTPYDTDPQGLYVTTRRIEADEAVDCMYLTFRSVELASSGRPEDALKAALGLRFRTRGQLEADGRVANYDERYEYAIDMVRSGKWGVDITPTIGDTQMIAGSRGIAEVAIIPKAALEGASGRLRPGDIVFFVKDPVRRVVGEIVGHIGIYVGDGMLVHASGRKNKGGAVVEVPLAEYSKEMPFIGAIVTRFGK